MSSLCDGGFLKWGACANRRFVRVAMLRRLQVPEWMLKLKNPGKRLRKDLQRRPVKRQQIKTVSKYDEERMAKKKLYIENSKKKAKAAAAAAAQPGAGEQSANGH